MASRWAGAGANFTQRAAMDVRRLTATCEREHDADLQRGATAVHGASLHAATCQRCRQGQHGSMQEMPCQCRECQTQSHEPTTRLGDRSDPHLAGAEVPQRRQAVLEHPRHQVAGGGPGAAHARVPARTPRCLRHPPCRRRPIKVSASSGTWVGGIEVEGRVELPIHVCASSSGTTDCHCTMTRSSAGCLLHARLGPVLTSAGCHPLRRGCACRGSSRCS